jgi:hypothetical protein
MGVWMILELCYALLEGLRSWSGIIQGVLLGAVSALDFQ